MSDVMPTVGQLSCDFYDAPIPVELENRMVELYGNAFCVGEFFRIFGRSDRYSAISITSSDPEYEHLICYDLSGRSVDILNELIYIDPICLDFICRELFQRHPGVTKINFRRIKSTGEALSAAVRVWSCSCDIIIPLPATVEEYQARLGAKIKRNMRYYLGRLQEKHPHFQFKVTHAADLHPSHIEEVISLNRARMESKSIRSGFDAAFQNNIVEFSRKYGAVATISIENEVVAGIICYDMGANVFGETIAHDSAYNEFSIGQVCLYFTLKYFIEKGARSFHTMEGDYAYKYRFLGENSTLRSVSLYRSPLHKMLDIGALCRHEARVLVRQLQYYRTVLSVAVRKRQLPVRRRTLEAGHKQR